MNDLHFVDEHDSKNIHDNFYNYVYTKPLLKNQMSL